VQPTPKLSPSPSTATSPRQAPNYQPYSQEQFLARLKTFAQVKKWTSKPDEIGEVAWARRGWSCDAWNTVACKGGCEKRVVVKLRPRREDAAGQGIEMSEDLAVDVDAALVRTYRDLIVTAHADDCLWRKKGCQGTSTRYVAPAAANRAVDDIYHIPIANRSKSTADLLARYASFLPLSADLPLLSNISYPPPSTPNILSHLPRAFFSPHPPPTSPTDTVAFTFALFGWSGITDSRISLATCSHCFQRLGLWLSSDTRLREMSSKLDVSMQSLRLNLLEAHREHCPWKNGEVQGNSIDGPIAGMSAWQTLQFILLAGRDAVTSRSSARDKDTTRDKDLPPTPTRPGHRRAADSVDVASESGSVYPRGSMESGERPALEDDEDEGLQNKWKKLKAKLKRTASKKSLRSVKSGKSGKSFGKDK